MHDQREGGWSGGSYHPGYKRVAAGITEYDNYQTAQAKLDAYDKIPSTTPKIPSPKIFTDPDVQKAIFKGLAWLTFFVLAFLFVFFQVPKYFNSAVHYATPHNSDNWEYRVSGEDRSVGNVGFHLAQVVTGKDSKANKITQEALIQTYKGIYGDVLTKEQYHDIANQSCDQGLCKDVSIETIRTFALNNGKVKEFDKDTANALTNYWTKADPKNKYAYKPFYISSCQADDAACLQTAMKANYRVSYRNSLEKEVQ